MITGTYNLVADSSWSLLQFQNVYLTVDASLAPVTINLPALSSVSATNVQIHVIVAVGGNSVTIVPFADLLAVPPVQNTISGGTSYTLYNEGETCLLSINTVDGVGVSWASNCPSTTPFIGGTIGGLDQATFALPQYVGLPIGWTGYVLDYNTSGFGCSVVKTSTANGDFNDWMISATEDTASTGGFGQVPA